MPATASLRTWLGLMTPDELNDLAMSYGWTASHLDWRERPRVSEFLNALDTLIVSEQQRRLGQTAAIDDALSAADLALAALDRLEVQDLFRSYRRLALNREKDASEPLQRFHAAVGDLLEQELTKRVRGEE